MFVHRNSRHVRAGMSRSVRDSNLKAFTAETTGELETLRLDSNTGNRSVDVTRIKRQRYLPLTVDGAEIAVFEQADKVGFYGLLQSTNGG